ncbi:MAG TPA: CAP domain-containing protein [Vulgatibacter sp.]|nr:CAP domain-containing protein [Vulgatibacter sp.]
MHRREALLLLAALSFTACATSPFAAPPLPRPDPIAAYGAAPAHPAHEADRRLAAGLLRLDEAALPWDEGLADVARILAGRAVEEGAAAVAVEPEEVRVAQARAGAVMADFHPFVVRAGDLAAATGRMREAVANLPADRRRRVGLGVVERDGVTMVLLLATAGVRLEPLPSWTRRGATLPIAGALVGGLEAPELTVTPPRGNPFRVPLESTGAAFRGTARLDEPGRWWIEILGRDERGPSVAVLLPIWVETPIPRRADRAPPPPEPAGVAEKERLLAAETNRLRASRGLAPLIVDPVLSRIARRYAEELRATGRFAHVSSISGDVRARLDAGGYAFERAGENLAHAPTALLAHRSLVQSPAHLAVLTQASWREAGFGVALVDGDGAAPGVIVVQIFAAPADR